MGTQGNARKELAGLEASVTGMMEAIYSDVGLAKAYHEAVIAFERELSAGGLGEAVEEALRAEADGYKSMLCTYAESIALRMSRLQRFVESSRRTNAITHDGYVGCRLKELVAAAEGMLESSKPTLEAARRYETAKMGYVV